MSVIRGATRNDDAMGPARTNVGEETAGIFFVFGLSVFGVN
jgi:hypothetical protein